jgi:mRNA-degrading endonuclease toxin of MazEF toxin-antitoxin module
VRGHEQAGVRPVLVISHDIFNQRSGTVIALAITASDRCDPHPAITLVEATSSEPDDLPGPGDGATTGDIFGAAIGTADDNLYLRAERDENGTGRVYRLAYEVVDASGNGTQGGAAVVVPLSRAGLNPRPPVYRPEPVAVGVTAVPPL